MLESSASSGRSRSCSGRARRAVQQRFAQNRVEAHRRAVGVGHVPHAGRDPRVRRPLRARSTRPTYRDIALLRMTSSFDLRHASLRHRRHRRLPHASAAMSEGSTPLAQRGLRFGFTASASSLSVGASRFDCEPLQLVGPTLARRKVHLFEYRSTSCVSGRCAASYGCDSR